MGDDEWNIPEAYRGKAKDFIMKVSEFNEEEAQFDIQSFVFDTKKGDKTQKANPGRFIYAYCRNRKDAGE